MLCKNYADGGLKMYIFPQKRFFFFNSFLKILYKMKP